MRTWHISAAIALAFVSTAALSIEYGQVISSTPVYAKVQTPRWTCGDMTANGPVMGGNIEPAGRQTSSATKAKCHKENVTESQIASYDVVYEYHGARRHARVSMEPGSSVELDAAGAQ